MTDLLISEEYAKITIQPSEVVDNHSRVYVELEVLAKGDEE